MTSSSPWLLFNSLQAPWIRTYRIIHWLMIRPFIFLQWAVIPYKFYLNNRQIKKNSTNNNCIPPVTKSWFSIRSLFNSTPIIFVSCFRFRLMFYSCSRRQIESLLSISLSVFRRLYRRGRHKDDLECSFSLSSSSYSSCGVYRMELCTFSSSLYSNPSIVFPERSVLGLFASNLFQTIW